jgi:hypothetical protein
MLGRWNWVPAFAGMTSCAVVQGVWGGKVVRKRVGVNPDLQNLLTRLRPVLQELL